MGVRFQLGNGNYVRFSGFFRKVSQSFQFWKALKIFSHKRTSQKTFLIPKFVIDTINWQLDLLSYKSGSNRARNFKLASGFALGDFEITCGIPPCIVLHSVQLLLQVELSLLPIWWPKNRIKHTRLYMSGFLKTMLKRKSGLLFFHRPFIFPSLPSFLCFFFYHFTWLGGGLKEYWNQGEIWVTGVKSFNPVFINPDIYFTIIRRRLSECCWIIPDFIRGQNTPGLLVETLISKFDFGPVKLPGLSRNGAQASKMLYKPPGAVYITQFWGNYIGNIGVL